MPDYSKTQQYKLHCNITGDDYYGHTVQTLAHRLSKHISDSNNVNNKYHCRSKQIIDGGDFEIIHLEYYPCSSFEEATARERWWIENHECVNKFVPGRTSKEWYQDNKAELLVKQKAHYEANKADIAVYQKEYRQKHKAEILAYTKAYQLAHKADIAVYAKAYQLAHKEEIVVYKKKYRQANKEEMAVKAKAYYQWNKSMDGLNRIQIY